MLALIQRVSHASVLIADEIVTQIDRGLLILCGFERADDESIIDKMLHKCLNYRVFSDSHGKMNLSVTDTGGGVIFVPQFTLAANTNSGLRPSFSTAALAKDGQRSFDYLKQQAKQKRLTIGFGQFGANMQVNLCNDGPVTFMLEA